MAGKPKPPKRSPEQIERRNGVRAYAVPLIAEMFRKEKGNQLPKEERRRTMAVGCIRWGFMCWAEEQRICDQEDDVTDRQQFSESEEGAAA